MPAPSPLLQGSDALLRSVERILAESGGPPEASAAVARVIDSHPESGRPSAAWYGRAVAAAEAVPDAAGLAERLLDALIAEPAPASGIVSADWHRVALGIIRFSAGPSSVGIIERLARIARSDQTDRITMACAGAMADPAVPRAATELIALERLIRHGLILIEIRKAIDALAAATGQTRADFEELAVETHELGEDGRRRFALPEGELEIEAQARGVTLRYVDAAGRARASIPARVRTESEAVVAEARAAVKAIKTTVASERARLDLLMASSRTWPLDRWRARYLAHPITGRMARACLWTFTAETTELVGMPVDASTVRLADGAEAPIPEDCVVALWHPVVASRDAIAAWRTRLLADAVVQPVKQAFREIYLLTPAEEETERYSNRFAGHIFKQVQARALFRRRGWRSTALAWWDDGNDVGVASKELPGSGLIAEFVYDPIEELEHDGELYPLCTSDQVRFRDVGSDEEVPLREVGLVPFSEAMRDVDLAISVTSIGADPEWSDRGLARENPGRFDGYYEAFTTGALGASAQVRHELLAGMLPALAIADRCTLEERFLVVRGDRTTYRIHLGTSNIRMEPDDRYLCIVSTRDARASRLFLPFDDDRTLTLILSKAFLLAGDAEIDDPAILTQISG